MADQVIHGETIAPHAAGEPIVTARNLELRTPLGCPFSGVNLDIWQGQVFAIRGRSGSGKTALLLTLAGRMLPTKGTLRVLGFKPPFGVGKIHKRVGMGFFEGLNELEDAQKVRSAVAAEFELRGRKAKKDAVAAYLRDWDLHDVADLRVSELTEQMMVRLGVALAWVGHPDIIVVDDIETGLTQTQSIEIMERLFKQARKRNVTIVVGVLERDLAVMADDALYLGERPTRPVGVRSQRGRPASAGEAEDRDALEPAVVASAAPVAKRRKVR